MADSEIRVQIYKIILEDTIMLESKEILKNNKNKNLVGENQRDTGAI